MTREEAILYLEHTGSDDFNLEEHQIQNRLNAIQFLLKENKKLNGVIQTYAILLKANAKENKQLKDNWNKVKNIIEDERMSHWAPGPLFLTELLISMEKIEKGESNE